MTPTNRAVTRSTTRVRKVASPSFQPPMTGLPDHENDRPRDHKGIPVDHEELISNLPTGAPFRISKLHLTNGEIAFACRDCLFTEDSRGLVMAHRNEKHGSRYGKKRPKLVIPKDREIADPILPPRPDGNAAPSNPIEMTLGEFLSLAPSLAALGDLVDRLERERDAMEEELSKHRFNKSDQHKIDVYDSLREEVITLRLNKAKMDEAETIRAENQELRTWKRKMIARLKGMGFQLTEEEQ